MFLYIQPESLCAMGLQLENSLNLHTVVLKMGTIETSIINPQKKRKLC